MTAGAPSDATGATVDRPTPSRRVRRRSRGAVARSAGGDRSLTVLIGLILLAAGALAALLCYGVFGDARAQRPLLDPIVGDTLRAYPLPSRIIAVAAGVLLTALGLLWAARSLRPERRPDLVFDQGPDTALVITASAAADAVGEQAGQLPGVAKARARLVGDERTPALRVTLWLTDEADVAELTRRLDEEVLAGARDSLGITDLPVAVRLELDRSVDRGPRVA